MEVDIVANIELDMVANMEVDKIADKFADKKRKVADKALDMGADMKVADIVATWWLTRRWTWWPTWRWTRWPTWWPTWRLTCPKPSV